MAQGKLYRRTNINCGICKLCKYETHIILHAYLDNVSTQNLQIIFLVRSGIPDILLF